MKHMQNVTRLQNHQHADKHKSIDAFEAIITDFIAQYTEENPVNETLVKKYYHDVLKEASRRLVLDDNIRLDGRKPDEIQTNCM